MANSFFSKILGGTKSDSVIGIDIGSSSIKVVQLKKKRGKAVLETYGELSLGPYADVEIGKSVRLPEEKIVEALRDVLVEAKASTRDSAISIPMKSSMVSIVTMPQMNESQLDKMIPIEARKYIPVPISEVSLDWFVIPHLTDSSDNSSSEKMQQNQVLVVAIHNDVLNSYSNIINASKLKTTFFEVEMFSTIRSVLEHGDNQPVMILDMGASATKTYIVERGLVRDSHIINRGSQEITKNISQAMQVTVEFAEKLKRNHGKNEKKQDEDILRVSDLVLSPIFSEVNSVLLNFQKSRNKSVSKVMVVGGGALLEGFVERAKKQIGIDVVPGDPFSKVETPAFLQDILKKTGYAFSTAMGLALRKLQEME
ncbi:MAG: type IV pilus assembly protein PilM [Candidatus Paceibacteria bacterium]|jgi:type IV pilus assembly protein PilM